MLGVGLIFDKRILGQIEKMMVTDKYDTRPRFVTLSCCSFVVLKIKFRTNVTRCTKCTHLHKLHRLHTPVRVCICAFVHLSAWAFATPQTYQSLSLLISIYLTIYIKIFIKVVDKDILILYICSVI